MYLKIVLLSSAFLCLIFAFNMAYATPDGDTSAYPSYNPPTSPNYYVNAALTGSNISCSKYGGDADHDGICDNWEKQPQLGGFNGLWINFTYNNIRYEYKLACDPNLTYQTNYTGLGVCPSPNHKDVYVEVDWMNHHDVYPQAINDTIQAFLNSPVSNIDGQNGIRLHIQYGEKNGNGNITQHYTNIKYASGNGATGTYVGFSPLKQNYFGSVAERTLSDPSHATFCSFTNSTVEKSKYCLTAKRFAFHYAMFANNMYQSPGTSGWSERPGNDMLLTLGSFADGKGSIDQQESAFMHELGHNLGLTHGGTQAVPSQTNLEDDIACKPNYLSIMSPTYEFRSTLDICRPLDYSHSSSIQSLDESNLSDNGVASYPYPQIVADPPGSTAGTCNNATYNGHERPIYYNFNGVTYSAITGSPNIDWNHASSPTTYAQNLNKLATLTGCQGNLVSSSVPLTSSDDWSNLNLLFVNNTNNFNSGGVPAPPIGEVDTSEGGWDSKPGDSSSYGIDQEATVADLTHIDAQPWKNTEPPVDPMTYLGIGIAIGAGIGAPVAWAAKKGTKLT